MVSNGSAIKVIGYFIDFSINFQTGSFGTVCCSLQRGRTAASKESGGDCLSDIWQGYCVLGGHGRGRSGSPWFKLATSDLILSKPGKYFLYCFIHPIFSSFGFWYFGHFSCVIFFPFFLSCPSCLAKCKHRLCNIFITSLPKVSINEKRKMG